MARLSRLALASLFALASSHCGNATSLPEVTETPTTSTLFVSCTDAASCELACREGRPETCATLAHFFETGQGVAQNLSRSVELYGKACGGYHTDACSHLAMLYDIGMGIPQDLGQAAYWYEQACALGDSWSCARKGELNASGLSTSASTPEEVVPYQE